MVSTYPTGVEHTGTQYLPRKRNQNPNLSPNQQLLPLTAKVNGDNCLEIGGCDVTTLVQQFGSPLYILDEETLRTACQQYTNAFKHYYQGESQVLYASKAWSCLAICAIVQSEGLGVDVASGGELYTALEAGVSPDKIYLHSNNKSRGELIFAVESGCTIVVDNWHELHTLVEIAEEQRGTGAEGQRSRGAEEQRSRGAEEQRSRGAEEQRSRGAEGQRGTGEIITQYSARTKRPANANSTRIMLRLTPGIECHTHEYIRTGQLDSKFGFDPNQLAELFTFVSQQSALNCVGLHAHIGSQIFERQPHRDLADLMVEWLKESVKYGLRVTELNVGGGLGITYTESDDPPSIEEWVKPICEVVQAACAAENLPLPKLLCEPGRSLVATACVTAYTIGASKTIPEVRTYVAVDGGMSDNPRPITYESVYRALIANKVSAPMTETVTIAGKHCESGDILIKNAQLPKTEPGDILVVMGTGAYNYSMASNYNRLPRSAAVLVANSEANLILQRETYQDLIRQDRLPERLKKVEG